MEVAVRIRYTELMQPRNFISAMFGVFFAAVLSACGSLERPSYRSSMGDYQDPAIRGPQGGGGIPRGPFQLHWPVDKIQVTQAFKPKKRRPHHGVDLDGVRNDPIYSAHEGFVIYAGSGFKGYGKMIIVQYDKEWASLYSHLNTIKVREGQYVKARQLIGRMGRTGRASGVHLHFELMRYKVPVDPLPLLNDEHRLVKY